MATTTKVSDALQSIYRYVVPPHIYTEGDYITIYRLYISIYIERERFLFLDYILYNMLYYILHNM